MKILLTCEHGGNQIPTAYRAYFKEAKKALNSHRGYDTGALDVYRYLASHADFAQYSEVSRLLVELNRSIHHHNLFSEYSSSMSRALKTEVLYHYYHPYRMKVEEWIAQQIKMDEEVLHISVHSFTPVLEGDERKTDIGLLYDPSRLDEQSFSAEFARRLKQLAPHLKVRMNYPYKGISDGFTKYLRLRFQERYSGIELEVNQRFAVNGKMKEEICQILGLAFHYLCGPVNLTEEEN